MAVGSIKTTGEHVQAIGREKKNAKTRTRNMPGCVQVKNGNKLIELKVFFACQINILYLKSDIENQVGIKIFVLYERDIVLKWISLVFSLVVSKSDSLSFGWYLNGVSVKEAKWWEHRLWNLRFYFFSGA